MAIFELKPEHYYHGMWRANFDSGDFLGLMWLEEGRWIFRYRFRYIKDEKVWGSEDTKKTYQMSLPDQPGNKERLFKSVHTMLSIAQEAGKCTDLEYYPCGGNGADMGKLMSSGIEGLHARRMTLEEYEKFKDTL